MAKSVEDLESYLDRLGRHYERLADGTLLLDFGPGGPPVALRVAPPVVLAQAEIGPCPVGGDSAANAEPLLRRLLELNASDLVHAAYGIEKHAGGDHIVLASAIALPSLDPSQLEAVLADIDVALSAHVPELRRLVDSGVRSVAKEG